MDIKQLNEELKKFLTNNNLKEGYGIPEDAEKVSEGPGAASYIMEKNGKYYVYWNIYGGGEQPGGVYDSKDGAIGEIVDDFANFDSWEEIEDSCTFYDDDLKADVMRSWAKEYEFRRVSLKGNRSDEQWCLFNDRDTVIMCIARVKDGFYLQNEWGRGEVYKEDEILHEIELELPLEDELIEVQNKPTLEDLKALPLVENPSPINAFYESIMYKNPIKEN